MAGSVVVVGVRPVDVVERSGAGSCAVDEVTSGGSVVVGTDDSVHATTPTTTATIKNQRIQHLPSQLNVAQKVKVHHTAHSIPR